MWFENFWNYENTWNNEQNENLNFNLSSLNDTQEIIKNQARDYILKEQKLWIDTSSSINGISSLLERQESENKALEKQVNWETKELLDREALINEAKISIYEILWINDNQKQNSPFENFSKWLVDEIILWNYEMAVLVINTKWKIIIDALKQLASFEWLKQMAKALWESVWDLFSWNAYEKWKSVAELWLITVWVWVWVSIWKKWFKLWLKQLAKLRINKEKLVESIDTKKLIWSVKWKVDKIIPKKQIDFGQMVTEDIAKLWNIDRLEAWKIFLKRDLSPIQEKAIIEAHKIWEWWVWNYNISELKQKVKILEKAWFNNDEIRILLEKWICWKDKYPKFKNLYEDPMYDFLKKHKDILWEDLKIDDIIWEWTQAIIIRHPSDSTKVIKIAREWKVDDILQEFNNHILFYDKWEQGVIDWDIDTLIKIPKVEKWKKSWYFIMEKVEWQSLYSKTLLERYKKILEWEKPEFLQSLTDNWLIKLLKTKYWKQDWEIEMTIEDYSREHLDELLWTSYKYRKEYWKVWWTPLNNAISYLNKQWIYHHDLHPWNIMLDNKWNVYIIDFGRIKIYNNK
jgi:hypothetical protein